MLIIIISNITSINSIIVIIIIIVIINLADITSLKCKAECQYVKATYKQRTMLKSASVDVLCNFPSTPEYHTTAALKTLL